MRLEREPGKHACLRLFRPVCDRRGNVVALFDESGALAEFYTYDGFGRTAIWAPGGGALAESAVGNTFLFSSKLFDSALGLYDFNARWYDPALGRFISPDPLGFVDGPNPYAYCAGDPVNFVDPWGLCAEGSRGDLSAWDMLRLYLDVSRAGWEVLRVYWRLREMNPTGGGNPDLIHDLLTRTASFGLLYDRSGLVSQSSAYAFASEYEAIRDLAVQRAGLPANSFRPEYVDSALSEESFATDRLYSTLNRIQMLGIIRLITQWESRP